MCYVFMEMTRKLRTTKICSWKSKASPTSNQLIFKFLHCAVTVFFSAQLFGWNSNPFPSQNNTDRFMVSRNTLGLFNDFMGLMGIGK